MNPTFVGRIQLVVTGIEDDCILKTCSQRKSTFPRAFAGALEKAFQELFVGTKQREKICARYFVRQKAPGKLLESFSNAAHSCFLEETRSRDNFEISKVIF